MDRTKPIEVYCIDADGYFTGRTDWADPCPETFGEWLIPGGTVPMPPPTHDMAVFSMRWDGFRWNPGPARLRGRGLMERMRRFFATNIPHRRFELWRRRHGR